MAFTATYFGSGRQEKNFLSCVLILVTNRSIVGENSISPHMKWDVDSLNFHSVCVSCFRDSRSASVFCISAKCFTANDIGELQAHYHIFFVAESRSRDLLVSDLFIDTPAGDFSVNTFKRNFVRPFVKAFKPSKIAFSSSTLICCSCG